MRPTIRVTNTKPFSRVSDCFNICNIGDPLLSECSHELVVCESHTPHEPE